MSRLIKIVLFLNVLGFAAVGADEPPVQDRVLDDHAVYVVPVSALRVTTISFPSPIAAIDGAFTTVDGKTPGLFQIAHVKGTAYFSIRALAIGANTNLNVRWNNRTYVFELREGQQACYSLILRSANEKAVARPLSPNRLLGLLDKAKSFALLQRYHPEAVRDVEYRDCHPQPLVSDSGDYEVRLLEAYRFPGDDTLVFQLTVSNKGDKPLQHWPERLEVRVSGMVFTPSIADLPAIIAPHGVATGYVAVTGRPTGGRNDLSLRNDFSFVLKRSDPTVESAMRDFEALQTTGLKK